MKKKELKKSYTLYIDESGSSNIIHSDKYFVMGGIIVEDSVDSDTSAYLRYMKRRHDISEDACLHAVDLFELTDKPEFLSEAKCKEFTESVAEYIENAPFTIKVYAVEKEVLLKKLKAPKGYRFMGSKAHKKDKEICYEVLTRKIIFDFVRILKKENATGSIVAESRRNSDQILLGTYLECQEPNIFEGRKALQALSIEAKDRIHSLCFSNKNSLKGGLEIVDIVSYCAFNELTKGFKGKNKKSVLIMWSRIKKKMNIKNVHQLTTQEISILIPDRINKISERIKERVRQFTDLFQSH